MVLLHCGRVGRRRVFNTVKARSSFAGFSVFSTSPPLLATATTSPLLPLFPYMGPVRPMARFSHRPLPTALNFPTLPRR